MITPRSHRTTGLLRQGLAAAKALQTVGGRGYVKCLREDSIAPEVKDAQYAVRGAIPARGEEINNLLKQGRQFPFEKMTPCNIGNPQAVGQGFMTFNREVLSCAIYPALLNSSMISGDAKERVKFLMGDMSSPMGAYTGNSKGYNVVRKTIAKYIEQRDGYEVSANHNKIYLTNGASEGVRMAFKLLLRDQLDGVMVPIPQYPLYSALLTLEGATMVKYYLEEENNWGINVDDMQERIRNAKDLGIRMRAMTVINPGNPTGQVLRRGDIENMIRLAYEHSMVILADEVYQMNIYGEVPFTSFRKVLAEMGEPYASNVELISLHSVSKGLQGECGLRGGYFETHNLNTFAEEMLYKLKSVELCSNTVGQIAAHLMIQPPSMGNESTSCVEQYEKEKNAVMTGLKDRAELLSTTFNSLDNMSSTHIEGSMYGFPKVEFSQKALAHAASKGVPPDFMYCLEMVNQTGIMTVPGSGFGQKEGDWHFRMTNLVTPTAEFVKTLELLKVFNAEFHDKYS